MSLAQCPEVNEQCTRWLATWLMKKRCLQAVWGLKPSMWACLLSSEGIALQHPRAPTPDGWSVP